MCQRRLYRKVYRRKQNYHLPLGGGGALAKCAYIIMAHGMHSGDLHAVETYMQWGLTYVCSGDLHAACSVDLHAVDSHSMETYDAMAL